MTEPQEIQHTIKLTKIAEKFKLEPLVLPENIEEIEVRNQNVNRPGMQLAGYYNYFNPNRIQLIGQTESSFVCLKEEAEKEEIFKTYLSNKPVCLIYARDLEPSPYCLKYAKEYNVPVYRTGDFTPDFAASIIAFLSVELAPRTTRHGVLVEIYGEGVLLLGSSGVGKSETAIELVKRGHRLIADDAVEIKKVSSTTLVGTAPEVIRHFIELRGIGIVDVRHIFGMGAVKVTEKIDLVINLEPWEDGKHYDRLGMDSQYTNILGIEIPSLVVPVRPGRNLAIILEVASMNNRHKKMGFNAAKDLSDRMEKAFNMPIEPIK